MTTNRHRLLLLTLLTAIAAIVGVMTLFQIGTTQADYETNARIPNPTNLRVGAVDGTTVMLRWNRPSGQVDGYQIPRRRMDKGNKPREVIVENTWETLPLPQQETGGPFPEQYADTSVYELYLPGEFNYWVKTIRNGKVSRASDSRTVAVQHPELAQHSFSEISHEAQRLSEVTRDLIAGCIGMAHEGLDGFPGLTDVATVTDGADCVPSGT